MVLLSQNKLHDNAQRELPFDLDTDIWALDRSTADSTQTRSVRYRYEMCISYFKKEVTSSKPFVTRTHLIQV